MKERAGRIEWIEAAKALAIVLVVLGHVLRGLLTAGILQESAVWRFVDQAIYSFHMPLMFLLSGMFLLRTSDAPGFFIGRGRRLIWPLFIWTYIYFGLKVVAGENQNTAIGPDGFPWLPLPPQLHFWFLWALFLCSAAVWCLRRLQKASGLADSPFWSVAALLSVAVAMFQSGKAPEWLAPALLSFPFVIAGILMPQRTAGKATPVRIVCSAAAMAVLLAFFGTATLPDRIWYLVSGVTVSLLLCYVIAAWAHLAGGVPAMVLQVGQATMAIYMAHAVISPLFRIVLLKTGVEDPVVHLVGGVIVGVCVPTIAFRMVRGTRMQAILGW